MLDAMDVSPSKNTKTRTKTHEMGVLDAVENETLESNSKARGSSPYAPTNEGLSKKQTSLLARSF